MVDELFDMIQSELRLDVFFNYRFADGQLRLEAHGGLSPQEAAAGATLELGQAVCGCVARDRRPVHATAVQSSDDPLVAFVKDVGLDAYACTPLIQGRELIGTLGFGRRWAERFDEDELHFLHTICSYVALAKHRLNSERQLRDALDRTRRLLAELNHRVRNSLQLITSIVALEASGQSEEARHALAHVGDRISVVAAAHQRLYAGGEPDRIEMGALLTAMIRDLVDPPASSIDLQWSPDDDHWLPTDQAIAFALAFDELLRSVPAGSATSVRAIRLAFGEGDGAFQLRVLGAAPPPAPGRILALLLRQLRAALVADADGTGYSVTVPVR